MQRSKPRPPTKQELQRDRRRSGANRADENVRDDLNGKVDNLQVAGLNGNLPASRVTGLSAVATGGNINVANQIPNNSINHTKLTGGIPFGYLSGEINTANQIPNNSINPSKLTGLHPVATGGNLNVANQLPNNSINSAKLDADSVNGAHIQSGSVKGTAVAGTTHIAGGSIGAADISYTLKGGNQNSYRLRQVGSRWGGNSGTVSANNHGHSVSYKELPFDKRQKIAASRKQLHAGFLPKTQMTLLSAAELGTRVWLLERQMAAILHMACDDPAKPASVREARIASGDEADIHFDRYAEYGQTYEELHPEATAFFGSFSLEELAP